MIISPDKAKATPYLQLLEREIELVAERLPRRRGVSQLHLGGGTPTYHSAAELDRLMGTFLEGLIVEAAIPTDAAQRARKIEASVVVGTPGTVMESIQKRRMDARSIKVLVLDEADNMLDQQGLGDQCIRVKG